MHGHFPCDVIMQSWSRCLCKWSRRFILVSRRDWPAWPSRLIRGARVSHSGWLDTFLPFSSHQETILTLFLSAWPTSCGIFMTSWLPHSLSIPSFSLFLRLRVFCMKMCSPFSAAPWSYLTELTFFYLLNLPSCLDKGTQESSCRLALFLTLQTYFFFFKPLLIILGVSFFLLLFYSSDSSSLITFISTFAPNCSLRDCSSVNLPLIVLWQRRRFIYFLHFMSTTMEHHQTFRPEVQKVLHQGPLDSQSLSCRDWAITHYSWFVLSSDTLLQFLLCRWAPPVSVTRSLLKPSDVWILELISRIADVDERRSAA